MSSTNILKNPVWAKDDSPRFHRIGNLDRAIVANVHRFNRANDSLEVSDLSAILASILKTLKTLSPEHPHLHAFAQFA